MKEPAIRFDGVSKWYRLGPGKGSLRDAIPSALRRLAGRAEEDGHSIWALKDVSFELGPGEALGIIGPNGAGKTTVLKILSRITAPTKGRVSVKGRVSALIELGAGFHPDLTGRDNIYLNGTILGLSRREINRRFDAIVAFSELETFIDTPVKRYSSGMYVRLGFSVAAHTDPDVLLVDEVLAVGDLAFQAKCRRRIRELIQQGVTIAFVSHNLHAVSHLCPRAIVLSKGHAIYDGPTEGAVELYRETLAEGSGEIRRAGTGEVEIRRLIILDANGNERHRFHTGDRITLRVEYYARKPVEDLVVNAAILTLQGTAVTDMRTDVDGVHLGTIMGSGHVDLTIDPLNLLPNVYTLNVTFMHPDGFGFYHRVEGAGQFRIAGGQLVNGTTYFPHSWKH